MCLAPAASMVEAAAGAVLCPGHHHHHSLGHDDGQRQQPHCWPGRKQRPCCPRPRSRVEDDDDAAGGGGGSKVRRPPRSSSAPVAIVIPAVDAVKRRPSSSTWAPEDDYYGDGDDDDEAAFVLPHEALEARWSLSERRAAASMCEGRGRTLKGRDLLSVRDAVLRKTGFIET